MRMNDTPMYQVLKRQLMRELADGQWQPGQALPPEGRLANRFGVSIGTLRKAIDQLVAERVLLRHQGRGTFVTTHGRTRLLFDFFRVAPRHGERQYPGTRTLSFKRAEATPFQAQRLGLKVGEKVFAIENLRELGGRPVIVDSLVLPHRLFPDLTLQIFTERESTIYNLYQTRYGLNVLQARDGLRATRAPFRVARLLHLPRDAPVLEITRLTLSYHDRPIELRRSLVNTEEYEYQSDLGKE